MRDLDHPEVRVGERVLEPGEAYAAGLMRCDVCGARWFDPEIAKGLRRKLDDIVVMQAQVDRLVDEVAYERKRASFITKLAFVVCIGGYAMSKILFP